MLRRPQRRVKRYAVRLEVSEINGQPSPEVYLVDLSSLGARLETSQPLAPRTPVHFSVLLPGREKVSRFSGQIIWTLPLFDAPGRFWMGLQFFTPHWEVERLAREGMIKVSSKQ